MIIANFRIEFEVFIENDIWCPQFYTMLTQAVFDSGVERCRNQHVSTPNISVVVFQFPPKDLGKPDRVCPPETKLTLDRLVRVLTFHVVDWQKLGLGPSINIETCKQWPL